MKKILFATIIMGALLLSIPTVLFAYQNATEQRLTSSLYMAPGTALQGQTYDFLYTNDRISLYTLSFYNNPKCYLLIDLYRKDFIGKTLLSSGIEEMSALNTTYTYYRGANGAFTGFYYFQTNSGGIQADPVYLYSYE